MLKVTIELIPGGYKEFGIVIGRGYIGNVSNLADLSDYVCKFAENPWQGRVYGPYLGTLTNWPRNERGAWQIVHAALSQGLSVGPSKQKQTRAYRAFQTSRPA